MYGTRRGTVTNPPSFEGLPDEALTSGTTELPFIGDEELREVLRTDISAAHLASSNGQWKAATGLVGSVVEALLHWLLQRPESQTSIAERRTRGELEGTPRSDIRRWDLANYINVAGTLDFIKEDTETPALLTKDFRNLIHPGRVERLGQQCDRNTAFSALAAIDREINDLHEKTVEYMFASTETAG